MVDVLPRARSRTLTVVLLAGVLPWLATLAALVLFGNAEHVNEPVHAAIEVAGACTALAVALLLSLRSAHEGVDGATLWVVAAFVAMGILDGAHGLASYGRAWSWLRHLSTLGAGLLVALVWLPLPQVFRRRRRAVIVGVALLAAGCTAAVLLWPDILPAPWDSQGYTLPVQLANFVGGLGFVAASAFFLRRRDAEPSAHNVLFASVTMLFGAASLLFGLSERWGAEWWTWHGIRLAAYVVVVLMAWRVLVALYRRVEDDARQLAAANCALEAEIIEHRRTEADLEAHRALLAAEAQLRESRRKFQALIETTSDFIWETDALGRYVYCSPQMEKLWGLKPEEMIGRTPFDVMPVEQRDRFAQLFAGMARSPQPFNGLESQAYGAQGRLIFVETSGVPFFDDDGRLLGYRGITRDVTARKHVEETLRVSEDRLRRQATDLAEANRLKDEFLSTLSHELRTPLSAILGWGSMLQKGALDPATTQKAYEAIVRNALAQRQLIDDTLDVARIVTGRLRIDVRKIDLGAAIAAVLDTIRPTADAKDITIACDVESALPVLVADAARLRQMLWNLLSNALKFTPSGGSVTVCARRIGAQVEVAVRDTGIGIGADFLPRVFERFSQADGSAARRHGGLGLGLAIVRHLAELHGATVEAESPGPGQGATFTIRFPIRPADLPRRTADAPNEPLASDERRVDRVSLSDVRVLLVDDDADARRVFTVALVAAGARVTTAASAPEGLVALERHRFDVLVGDIGMPGEDGYSFMRQVRALPVDAGGLLPALALTAYARAEDRAAALSAGYQEHLAKPVTPEVLVGTVAMLLGGEGAGGL